jgi:tetratricopeptide (TPR) repeat protein
MHGRIAEQLERRLGDELDDHVAELAGHWLEAGGNPDKAVDCASRAGARAVAQLVPDDGLNWYRRALDVLDRTAGRDDPRRGAVLTGLGDAQRQTGDPGHRETLLAAADLARRLGNPELLARAVVANNRGMLNAVGVADAERLEALEAAERATEGATTPTRALVLATLAAELAFVDRARMLRVARAAIELARRLGDDHALVTVITRLEAAIGSPDTLVERTALADEAIAVAERTGDPVLRWYAAAMGYTPALEGGDIRAFRQRVELVDELARGIGQPFMRWVSAIARSAREHLAGNLDRADAIATEGLEIGVTSGQTDALVFYAGALIGIRLDQGRLGELVGLAEGASADNNIPGTRSVLALCYCEIGRKAEAVALLEDDASDDFSRFPFDPMWTSFMSVYTRVADKVGDQRAASRLAGLLEPWCDQIAMSGAGVWGGSLWSSFALALATAGRHDAAESAFARAAAVHEQIEAPLLLSRTHADWAGLLIQREPGRSRELARSARTVAADLGAWSIERQAGELLDQLDATPAL